jgi:predicted permease
VKALFLIIIAIIVYFLISYVLSLLYRWMFPLKSAQSSTVKESIIVIAVFMTILSLGAVVFLKKPLLAMPGVYVGLVLSMLLGGERHGPGDPYTWSLFAAPINFFLYYGLVRVAAKHFPSFF